MNFRKINNITGWIVGLIACAVYILSREAGGSFWDCGEFVSSAYKVQMPHPPGAPLFVLLGRFFIILFGNNPQHAASAVNLMSAVASGLSILFLFWTITHFARKMFVKVGEEMTNQQIFTVMTAGVVGAMAYCFTDSFWYSAVEGEVYALSAFFTALVFWAMLKWEHADEKAGADEVARARADRWLVFIFFMMGLSIGVHLLNLLTIPAIVMIYYFRRYQYSTRGAIFAFLLGCAITGLVQVVVIKYSMHAAAWFDIFAVNTIGLGFFTGFIFYFVLVTAMIVIGLRFKENKVTNVQLSLWLGVMLVLLFLPKILSGDSGALSVIKFLVVGALGLFALLFKKGSLRIIKLAIWCYAFTMLGMSTYFTTLIRSNADPAIDMYNIDNPMSLVGLLNREQYGDWPILRGQHFLADRQPDKEGDMKYGKGKDTANGKDKYVEIGREIIPQYDEKDLQLFPRTWDASNDQGHRDFYISWLNLDAVRSAEDGQVVSVAPGGIQVFGYRSQKTNNYPMDDNFYSVVQEGQNVQAGEPLGVAKPTYRDNMEFFFTYQLGLMYWRYFMWNFAGKQNDLQGFGNVRDGNWLSGLSYIDNPRLGDQSKIPDSSKNNKAHNKLYLLPFLLGILGCVFQFIRNKKDWTVVLILFFLSGIAIIIYLNQPGNQPRERDYAFAGSFYAFAIWIGLAVPALISLVRGTGDKVYDKTVLTNTLIFGSVLTFLIGIMSSCYGSGKGAIISSILMTATYVGLTLALTYIIKAISNGGKNLSIANFAIAVVCGIVPIIMGQQEWDDHDRSKKRLARDSAVDYLQSCPQNAILFTFGDNDTYPLWYAQEVEGVRPDIRIINNSLLGIDWYINQLRYKINQSAPIDVIVTANQIAGDRRTYTVIRPPQNETTYSDLYTVLKENAASDDPAKMVQTGMGPLNVIPTRKFSIPVDTNYLRAKGLVNPGDIVLPTLQFDLPPKSVLYKSDLAILAIIASTKWQRPICFTSPYGSLGFGDYLRKDGLTYRLVPVAPRRTETNWFINRVSRVVQMRDINTDSMKNAMMNKFMWTSGRGVYFDEENRRHALAIRGTYAEAAGDLADLGRKEEAKQLLHRCDSSVNNQDLPYGMIWNDHGGFHNVFSLVFLEACYKAGDMQLVKKVKDELTAELKQEQSYFEYLKAEREAAYQDLQQYDGFNKAMLEVMDTLDVRYNPNSSLKQITPNPNANGATPPIKNDGSNQTPANKPVGIRTDTGKKK